MPEPTNEQNGWPKIAIHIPSTPAGVVFLATYDRIWNEVHTRRFARTGKPCDLQCCAPNLPNTVDGEKRCRSRNTKT